MNIGEIIALVVALCVAVGLWVTWQRNGTEQRERDIAQATNMASWKSEIKTEMKHINEELKSEDHGLVALAKGQGAFATHCAKLSTSITGQVNENSRDIEELKTEAKKRRR